MLDESTVHLFFYIGDEEGNLLGVRRQEFGFHDATLLAFGSHKDVGGWEVHLESQVWIFNFNNYRIPLCV